MQNNDYDDDYQTFTDWLIAGAQALAIVGTFTVLALAYFDCLFY